jgi:hypothetical protein
VSYWGPDSFVFFVEKYFIYLDSFDQDFFGYSGVKINFRIIFLFLKQKYFRKIFLKHAIGVFIGIALNMQIALGSMKNFTIFFQICEHRIPLYLFPYSFFNVFQ